MSRTPSERPFSKRARDAVVAAIAFGIGAVVRRLPTRIALRVGDALGGTLRRAMPRRADVARENLARAFPDRSESEREALLREHFRHLGRSVVELLLFPQWERRFANRIRLEGKAYLDRAVKNDTGVVVFIPHTGNWEILAPLWPSLHPNPMVIAQPMPNPALDRLVTACRRVNGIELVPRQGGLKRIVSGLRRGRACGLLADQDAGTSGLFVSFFGEAASCESSPVRLARRLRVPLLLCATFRERDGTHRVCFEPIPLVLRDSDEESDRATLQALYARLEALIRGEPAQWLWIHRRWKTRPPVPASSH